MRLQNSSSIARGLVAAQGSSVSLELWNDASFPKAGIIMIDVIIPDNRHAHISRVTLFLWMIWAVDQAS